MSKYLIPCRLAYERLCANGYNRRALSNQLEHDALGLPNDYPLVVAKWSIFDLTITATVNQ